MGYLFFFFNDTATTEIYTLSLHDALPICSLRSLSLHDRYRSDQEDVVATFYVPAFTVASSYSRAVGYFTSSSLALYARGIEMFAARGGTMRLIASPHLSEDDIVDIEDRKSTRLNSSHANIS